jgi:hypothetical protein
MKNEIFPFRALLRFPLDANCKIFGLLKLIGKSLARECYVIIKVVIFGMRNVIKLVECR